jgi:hypothetical protein
MITGITLIILSIIAVPSIILAKKPNAKELLNKVAPYQGWIGLIFCFWGIYGVIFSGILGLSWIKNWPIFWITTLLVNIMQTVLGFILGYGMISKYVFSKSEEARKKGEQVLAKLASIQGKLGIAGILIGCWCIVASFLFHSV